MQTKRTHLSPLIREEARGFSSGINVNIIGIKIGEMNLQLTYQLYMLGRNRKEKQALMNRYINEQC